MKADQRIELFLSLMAYSNGQWSFNDIKESYEYLKKEINTDNVTSITRIPTDKQNIH